MNLKKKESKLLSGLIPRANFLSPLVCSGLGLLSIGGFSKQINKSLKKKNEEGAVGPGEMAQQLRGPFRGPEFNSHSTGCPETHFVDQAGRDPLFILKGFILPCEKEDSYYLGFFFFFF